DCSADPCLVAYAQWLVDALQAGEQRDEKLDRLGVGLLQGGDGEKRGQWNKEEP
ncbi:unnamed protein product, partial [Prorocentrum cordatum]